MQYKIRIEIKTQIRQGISDEELTEIIIPVSAESKIKWVKDGKEFRYKGEMYDVVRTKIKNGHKHLYCLWDKEEKNLIDHYNRLNHKGKRFDKKMKRVQLFFQDSLKMCSLFTNKLSFSFNNSLNIESFLLIDSPPPRQNVS